VSVYPFIEAEKAEPEGNVAKACHLLEVSRSAYYEWSSGTPSARELADAELADKVVDIFTKSRRTYGAPRITTQLAELGIRVGKKRVARLMVRRGLAGRAKRRFKKTTIADPISGPCSPIVDVRQSGVMPPDSSRPPERTLLRGDRGETSRLSV